MVNGVVAIPGWSGRVTGKVRGCDTTLQLEREQDGFESARESDFYLGHKVEMLP